MSNPKDKTDPNLQPVRLQDEIAAPPRILLWGVIGLFVLLVGGFIAGIIAFNVLLTSGQQVRVINRLPWMETFQHREPTPQGGILPTVDANVAGGNDASNLLNFSISGATNTPEAEVNEATRAGMIVPTIFSTTIPTNIPSPVPSNTPVPLPSSTSTAAPAPVGGGNTDQTGISNTTKISLPDSYRNYGFQWARQTWNNCGPATLTTALTYFGWVQDQDYAKRNLRPNREDKNVSPEELVNFVNTKSQVRALWRVGGNTELLRALIANGFPVMVERGMMFEANDWLGHYQALVAYDDSQGVLYAYDSFLGNGSSGEGEQMRYNSFDEDWKAFNRLYIVIYQPQDEAHLQSILGVNWDQQQAAENALLVAQEEARANQADGFAWHNMGTSLTLLGRYEEASSAFDIARQTNLHWRILWYQFGMFESYYHVGRYDDVISLAQINLNQSPELEESYYWRGMALIEQGKPNEAASNFRTALRYNPNFIAAQEALSSISG